MTFLSHDELVELTGAIGLLLILWTLYRVHTSKKNTVDFTDLFIDPKTGKIGGSEARVNLAFLLSSWVLVFLAMKDLLSEWFFLAYTGTFVADRALARIGQLGVSNDQKNTTTTSTPTSKPGITKPDPDDVR